MTAGKASAKAESNPTPECCMCGDQGLSYELFNCKICQFRSQHRYCSNLYPKAETYKVCNWCLSQKYDTTDKIQNSLNSSSSHKNNENSEHGMIKIKKKSDQSNQGGVKGQKGNLHLQGSNPIKKHRPPERVAVADGRRKLIAIGGLKDRLRRTKSEDISNSRGKQVIRGRVRRYKLLDEVVSSQ